MIIGVDLGYGYPKTSEGVIFASKITEHKPLIGDYPEIILDNKKYYVGTGNRTLEVNKTNEDITKVLLFTSLALSSEESNFKVVTGLPIAQHQSKQREELKNMILSNNRKRIIFNNKDRMINITDVEIFPQSAASLYASDIKQDVDVIIVDIGAGTTDIGCFIYVDGKRKLTKSSTLYHGMLVLFSDIIKKLNQQFDLALEIEDAYKIIKNGLYINGIKQDLSCLKPVIFDFTEKIFDEIMLNYPYKTVTIYLTGGGAEMLIDVFKKKFPNTHIIPNSQFSNAIGMKRIGVALWN